MAYTTIDDASEYFHTQLYTGTGSELSVTNDANAGNFKPDWIWIKQRNASTNHGMFDSNRGVKQNMKTDTDDPEGTENESVKTFNTDGFTLGTSGDYNGSSDTHVAWQWIANGGTTSSNSDGSITSTVQANTTAGLSIVTYTGTGSTATVGHGLGVKPSVIIIKARTEPTGGVHFGTDQGNWIVYHQGTASDPETDLLLLNKNSAVSDSTGHMNDTAPTTSVFTIHTNVDVNESSDTYVAYCFAEVQGYSKFGSYTGNGSTDGPFVYLGFKPAWVMIKKSSGADSWIILDNKRTDTGGKTNPVDKALYAESNTTEYDETLGVDFLSNGFKYRDTGGWGGGTDGATYIYMAFAEHPFVSSEGVPTTAR